MRTFCITVTKGVLAFNFIVAAIVGCRAAMVTMPYRVLETEFYRWETRYFIAAAFAFVSAIGWTWLAKSRVEKRIGRFVLIAIPVAFLMTAPGGMHSLIRVKYICINQLREIDGAKEQWADVNGKHAGDDVDARGLAELFKEKKIPECPEGGAYRVGKIGELPQCSIAEHQKEFVELTTHIDQPQSR